MKGKVKLFDAEVFCRNSCIPIVWRLKLVQNDYLKSGIFIIWSTTEWQSSHMPSISTFFSALAKTFSGFKFPPPFSFASNGCCCLFFVVNLFGLVPNGEQCVLNFSKQENFVLAFTAEHISLIETVDSLASSCLGYRLFTSHILKGYLHS